MDCLEYKISVTYSMLCPGLQQYNEDSPISSQIMQEGNENI